MMYLEDTDLPRLWLHDPDADTGAYVVTDIQIGKPAVRAVSRYRALASGARDDTNYYGERAISFNVMVNDKQGDPQLLFDALDAFLQPHRRPRLTWAIPGSPDQVRSAVVRVADNPLSISRRKYNSCSVSVVVPAGVIEDPEATTLIIQPSSDTEAGRTYDLTFPRTYPPTLGIGARLVQNRGNAYADWTAQLFGEITDPLLTINDITISFDQNGGLDLTVSNAVHLDTVNQTILFNGDPGESRYDLTNFPEWAWNQIRLHPGDNFIRLDGATVEPTAKLILTYRSTWG